MFKLDNAFLQELGLGSLPAQEKNMMLKHIYDTLEDAADAPDEGAVARGAHTPPPTLAHRRQLPREALDLGAEGGFGGAVGGAHRSPPFADSAATHSAHASSVASVRVKLGSSFVRASTAASSAASRSRGTRTCTCVRSGILRRGTRAVFARVRSERLGFRGGAIVLLYSSRLPMW